VTDLPVAGEEIEFARLAGSGRPGLGRRQFERDRQPRYRLQQHPAARI